ncbi:hypothetical protein IWW37_000809 [Coemansia sp. RSA 2050]|nr:hypothetical protein IWW37_000809 [Coemansia sp. RSA 2050]KAJ2736575.1 hypothetical protein IW152_000750 [Coemansia sp. BCRC 34962]
MGSSSKRKTKRSKCLLDIPDDSSETTALPLFAPKKDTKPACHEDKSRSTNTTTRKTFRIEPPSDLLSRLHSFLPQIAIANKQLQADIAEDPRKLDIENVGEDEEQYIEMDLGLGVFDMKPRKDGRPMEDVHISTRAMKSEDCSASDAEDSSSRILIDPSSISARHRPKPQIQVLSNGTEDDGDALMDHLI